MPRVKRGNKRLLKRKKILRRAKGYYLAKSKLYRIAKEQVQRSLKFAYRDRRAKKRQFRRLWIVRINAAAREHDISYSRLMHAGGDCRSRLLRLRSRRASRAPGLRQRLTRRRCARRWSV